MISSLISYFGESGPTVHVSPAQVTQIAGIPITNSMLYGWICAVIIVVLLVWTARRVTIKPKRGFVQIIEVGVDFISNMVEGAFEDKKKARKYVPFFVTLFFFILLNNLLGLLPFVGEGLKSGDYPLFRPFTADLNATLALGLITMIVVYAASIHESGGFRKYVRHFFIGNPLNPFYFFVGLLEVFTDLTRVLSLSLRLFLNITIGEIVIAVFSYLGHILAPLTALPFTLLEVLVAGLQAYIFTILATMYLAIVVNHANDHKTEHLIPDDVTETIVSRTTESASGKF